jgi:hypothetical protein
MKKITQAQAKKIIDNIIELSVKFKSAYFFSPPPNASSRRKYEKENSISEKFYFIRKGEKIECEISFKVRCSCKNIYINRLYKINNELVTLAGLKKLFK